MNIVSTHRPADSSTQAFRVILHNGGSRPGELVTHVENLNPDGTPKARPDYYWGHYFTDAAEALNDFMARCRKYGVKPAAFDRAGSQLGITQRSWGGAQRTETGIVLTPL